MASRDLEKMSLDELEAEVESWVVKRTALKAKVNEAKEVLTATNEYYKAVVAARDAARYEATKDLPGVVAGIGSMGGG